MAGLRKLSGIERIAIVGAGPAGVAAAKYLLAEKIFAEIDIYEQRSTVSGVWNYTGENDDKSSVPVPQTSPFAPLEKPIWCRPKSPQQVNGDSNARATFVSPLYETLEANLPKMIMQYGDQPFSDEDQLFPTHETIAEYLEWYADDVRPLIKFETQVTDIRRAVHESKTMWHITTQHLSSRKRQMQNYDAVAIASGHYAVPFIPDIAGIQEWNGRNPGVISHSKYYRRPQSYRGKKVLVIGQGYSGLDIASQITPICAQPLYISTRTSDPSATGEQDEAQAGTQHVPEISEFLPASAKAAIRFTDGTVVDSFDAVIFCTGYLYSYPFFLDPASASGEGSTSTLPAPILPPSGARTLNAYKHIFYNADPSLAFLALPQKVVPFPISEGQAAVVARVWAGRLGLPPRDEMLSWEAGVVEEMGDGTKFHYMNPPKDGDYLNELFEWCVHADGEGQAGLGKVPPRWEEKERWIRERILEMKRKFAALGEKRREIRTLEKLGYSFDKWKSLQA